MRLARAKRLRWPPLLLAAALCASAGCGGIGGRASVGRASLPAPDSVGRAAVPANLAGTGGVSPPTAVGAAHVRPAGGPWAAPTEDVRPALTQLQEQLQSELARLGKSAKTPASAPGGARNAVFDLAAAVIDPDGPPDGQGGGELPPTGIALSWTERLLGDYDQNGQVNVPDLVPLAAHWLESVAYDDPALHGGIAF